MRRRDNAVSDKTDAPAETKPKSRTKRSKRRKKGSSWLGPLCLTLAAPMLYIALSDDAWVQAEQALAFVLSSKAHGGGGGSVLGDICPLGYTDGEENAEDSACVQLVKAKEYDGAVACYSKTLDELPGASAVLDGVSAITAAHLQQLRRRTAVLKAVADVHKYKHKASSGGGGEAAGQGAGEGAGQGADQGAAPAVAAAAGEEQQASAYPAAVQAYEEIGALWAQVAFRIRAGGEVEEGDALGQMRLIVAQSFVDHAADLLRRRRRRSSSSAFSASSASVGGANAEAGAQQQLNVQAQAQAQVKVRRLYADAAELVTAALGMNRMLVKLDARRATALRMRARYEHGAVLLAGGGGGSGIASGGGSGEAAAAAAAAADELFGQVLEDAKEMDEAAATEGSAGAQQGSLGDSTLEMCAKRAVDSIDAKL